MSKWVTMKEEERVIRAALVEENGLSPPRRPKHESPDMSPPRRRQQRHDSPNASPPRRRQRHDSSPDASPPRRIKRESPDMSPPRRRQQRHDSPNASPPRRRQRHDSSPDAAPPRRQKRDSRDTFPPRRHRHEGPDRKPSRYEDKVLTRKPATEDRTASGYKAGLQSSGDFRQVGIITMNY